ncbi:MAG: hypothetical protein H7322_17220 [Ramlibacter sp.]|nr:hypothetical protein [Ramlibacter sp.]
MSIEGADHECPIRPAATKASCRSCRWLVGLPELLAAYAPAGTPPEIVARLNREINKILALPAVRTQIATIGAEPSPMSPAQFAALMADDSKRYGAVIRERGIRAD